MRRLLAAAVVLVLGSGGSAHAATWYVAPSGSDTSGTGSLAAPWRTLPRADAVARAGDTIYLRAGDYGAVGTTETLSGAGLTWASYPGEQAVLRGRHVVSGAGSRFTTLRFHGPTGPIGGTGCNGESVLVDVRGAGIRVDHSEVTGSLGHAGLYVSYTPTGVSLDHNWVHDNGCDDPAQDHGIYWYDGSGTVADNLVEHNVGRGISLHYEPDDVLVANNTVVRNGGSGIHVDTVNGDITLAGNVIAHNGWADRFFGIRYVAGTNVTAVDTLFHDNAGGNVYASGAPLPQSGSVTADPLFANDPGVAAGRPGGIGDYHLTAASPAVGMASSSYAPATDYDDETRDAAPDAGYDEYVGARRVGSTAAVANDATGVTVATPAGVVAGDVLVAQLTYRGSAGVTAPSGWSLVRGDDYNSGTHQAIYVRVAGAIEPTGHTFTTPSAQGKGAGIAAWRGIDTSSPIAASSGTTGVSGSADAPGLTVAEAHTPLLLFAGALNGSVCWTPPATMTERWDLASSASFNVSLSHADALRQPGATGTVSALVGCAGSVGWMAQLVALDPA